ncbi:MAG: NAD(P)/FAD-dependent oxidoreductase [Deltaproteobacteria bacterium]|nr:NAD(P)/FAD-dependent oxidoreductase [Deltaproteobacteria bacterium]
MKPAQRPVGQGKPRQVVIIGGGTGGIDVAARLVRVLGAGKITIVDPAQHHDYQPMWTLVGAGQVTKESTRRNMESLIPKGVEWLKDAVVDIQPERNLVKTKGGKTLEYEYLVAAPGIQLDWDKVAGLKESVGKGPVVSNYAYDTVDSTWQAIQSFKGGTALFTMPAGLVKCPGAPQKIMWLMEDHLRRNGQRNKAEVVFASAGAAIFGIPRYREALEKLLKARGVKTLFGHNLVAVDARNHVATFETMDTKQRVTLKFDMIHVTPPQSAPDFIKKSPLAGEGGWIPVDKHTTQHVKYPNVFALGDATNMPCSKTGAAIRKQAPVLVNNLQRLMMGQPLNPGYDGYASCPLVVTHNKVIMAEFGYDGKIMETFPIAQNKPRYSMYLVKRYLLPKLYWDFMMKGRA